MIHRFACFLSAALTASGAFAGQLAPPAGPVTPTGRFGPSTEINAHNTPGDADSTYKITQQGSYYLAGNVAGQDGRYGIEIAVPNVVIDMRGHAMLGLVFLGSALDAIHVSAADADGVVIRNGTLRAWAGDGIDATSARSILIEDVDASLCGGHGFHMGDGAHLVRCHAIANGLDGVFASGTGAVLEACVARENTEHGFHATLDAGVLARGCHAIANGDSGFDLGRGAAVIECSAISNQFNGIEIGQGAVINCVARDNLIDGIYGGSDSRIVGNTCNQNGKDGIEVTSDCLITHNSCNENGQVFAGAGIRVLNDSNRIDSNHAVENDTGFRIDGLGNLIIRNSASLNTTNFFIAVPNDAAPQASSPVGAGPWDNLIL